jgi:hypothetical protein
MVKTLTVPFKIVTKRSGVGRLDELEEHVASVEEGQPGTDLGYTLI